MAASVTLIYKLLQGVGARAVKDGCYVASAALAIFPRDVQRLNRSLLQHFRALVVCDTSKFRTPSTIGLSAAAVWGSTLRMRKKGGSQNCSRKRLSRSHVQSAQLLTSPNKRRVTGIKDPRDTQACKLHIQLGSMIDGYNQQGCA